MAQRIAMMQMMQASGTKPPKGGQGNRPQGNAGGKLQVKVKEDRTERDKAAECAAAVRLMKCSNAFRISRLQI